MTNLGKCEHFLASMILHCDSSCIALIFCQYGLSTDMLWLNDNTFSGDFTCPDFITLCFISCLDKEILEALNEYDEENEEAILQALNSTKNSTCRSL